MPRGRKSLDAASPDTEFLAEGAANSQSAGRGGIRGRARPSLSADADVEAGCWGLVVAALDAVPAAKPASQPEQKQPEVFSAAKAASKAVAKATAKALPLEVTAAPQPAPQPAPEPEPVPSAAPKAARAAPKPAVRPPSPVAEPAAPAQAPPNAKAPAKPASARREQDPGEEMRGFIHFMMQQRHQLITDCGLHPLQPDRMILGRQAGALWQGLSVDERRRYASNAASTQPAVSTSLRPLQETGQGNRPLWPRSFLQRTGRLWREGRARGSKAPSESSGVGSGTDLDVPEPVEPKKRPYIRKDVKAAGQQPSAGSAASPAATGNASSSSSSKPATTTAAVAKPKARKRCEASAGSKAAQVRKELEAMTAGRLRAKARYLGAPKEQLNSCLEKPDLVELVTNLTFKASGKRKRT